MSQFLFSKRAFLFPTLSFGPHHILTCRQDSSSRGVLLEMAYKPAFTSIMQMAEEVGGWKTIQGLETLVTQGMWQFEHWTGVRVRGVGTRLARGIVVGEGR